MCLTPCARARLRVSARLRVRSAIRRARLLDGKRSSRARVGFVTRAGDEIVVDVERVEKRDECVEVFLRRIRRRRVEPIDDGFINQEFFLLRGIAVRVEDREDFAAASGCVAFAEMREPIDR